MVNIAVLVSGGGSNLQAIIDAERKNELGGGSVRLVISSKDGAFALTRAAKAGIKTAVFSKKDFAGEDELDKSLCEFLKAEKIDLVVLAGYLSKIGKNVTESYRNKIMNVHPSLIPSFSGPGCYGLKVHEMALSAGVKVSGATVHFVSEVIDGGPIILQKAVEVFDADTKETLQKRIMEECEWILLPKAVRLYCEGRITVKDQKVIIK